MDRICPNLSNRTWGKVSAPGRQGEMQGALVGGLLKMGTPEKESEVSAGVDPEEASVPRPDQAGGIPSAESSLPTGVEMR